MPLDKIQNQNIIAVGHSLGGFLSESIGSICDIEFINLFGPALSYMNYNEN